jgi:hypothetical protein
MTEFYVGYLPKAPSGIARKMKAVIVLLFVAATTCAIGFAALQRTYARSFFESGKERTFEGSSKQAHTRRYSHRRTRRISMHYAICW